MGLPYSSTHICRHTGATKLLDETGYRLAVQQMGNWRTSQQAEYYGQIRKDRARDAVRRADEKSKLKLVTDAS